MEVRTLRQEEMPRFAAILRDAFVTPDNFEPMWLEMNVPEDTRGIFDDEGKLLGGLRLIDMELWLGARKVKVSGVTNVATPPEYRRRGQLKQLLRATLAEDRARGYNLSALYPFEFPFYRKFGYELAATFKEVSVSMSAMRDFKSQTPGEWIECTLTDWQQFQAIYTQYCVGRFGRLGRAKERSWRLGLFLYHTEGGDKPRKAYLWQDASGQPRAYLLYSFKKLTSEWDRELQVREMVWLDEEARHEIYSFLANHDSQASKISWNTEPGDDFFSSLSDPRQAEVKQIPGYMLRLVDVERALTERAWPSPDGKETASFSVAVRDDVLSWNDNRTYRLEVAPGQTEAHLSVALGTEQAGLVCDVRTLAQLYAGYLSPKEAARLRKLEVRRPADLEMAQRLFSPADQPGAFMNDWF